MRFFADPAKSVVCPKQHRLRCDESLSGVQPIPKSNRIDPADYTGLSVGTDFHSFIVIPAVNQMETDTFSALLRSSGFMQKEKGIDVTGTIAGSGLQDQLAGWKKNGFSLHFPDPGTIKTGYSEA